MKKKIGIFIQFLKIPGMVNYCVQVGCQSEQVSCQLEAKRPCRSEAKVAALVGRASAASAASAAHGACMVRRAWPARCAWPAGREGILH